MRKFRSGHTCSRAASWGRSSRSRPWRAFAGGAWESGKSLREETFGGFQTSRRRTSGISKLKNKKIEAFPPRSDEVRNPNRICAIQNPPIFEAGKCRRCYYGDHKNRRLAERQRIIFVLWGLDVWKKTIEKSETSRRNGRLKSGNLPSGPSSLSAHYRPKGGRIPVSKRDGRRQAQLIEDTLKPEQFTGRVWAFVRERIQPNFPNRDWLRWPRGLILSRSKLINCVNNGLILWSDFWKILWRRSSAGRGRVAGIVGELGSGKVSVFDLPSEQKVPILGSRCCAQRMSSINSLRGRGSGRSDEYEALKKRERDEETDRRYTQVFKQFWWGLTKEFRPASRRKSFRDSLTDTCIGILSQGAPEIRRCSRPKSNGRRESFTRLPRP